MRHPKILRRLMTGVAVGAAALLVSTGTATAEPATIDPVDAVEQLREVATGNKAAEEAIDALLADKAELADAAEVALPAQPFQVPAQSDIGRGDGPGVYGSGIALGVDGFRFGFFGGPGTIAPNQEGARLEVIWLNLSTGASGTEVLTEHEDIPVDTTIRTQVIDPGPGMVVAAVYGSLWHRWPVPVSDEHPDGFQYQLGTISFPSLGSVVN